jgi:hypothetical protein
MFKSNSYRLLSATMLFALCLGFGGGHAFAQANASAGQVVGAVRDNNGAVVAGAKVRIVNSQTGLEQTATSSEDGLFRFVLLPPGTYRLTAEASNFAKAELTGVKVTVGQVTDTNVTLGVGAVSEAVTVTAEAVQTTVSQPDAVINETQINNLPINGRRFQDFVTLTPTAQVDPSRGQISLSGQRGINANVNIDGVDYNQPFFGGLRGGERSNSVFTIPQESVKEFQVIAAGYSAEFGRSTGGLVTAVTKSGTNELHGSAFYLIRPQELARSNAFYDTLARSLKREIIVSPTQHQFGGSIGGRIKKDKMFYFGSYEQQRFRNPRVVFFDPLATFTPTAGQQEAFDFYKTLQVPFEQTNDAKAGLVRFDWNISDRNRFNVRYNQSYANALNSTSVGSTVYNQPAINNAISNNGTEQDKTYTVVGQFTTTLNSNLINELRGQYSREVRPRLANAEAPNVTNNIGRYGTVNFLPTTQFDYRIQVFNNLTWLMGNHSVKFGAEGNQVFASQVFGFNQFGVFGSTTTDTATILDVLSYTPTITGGTVNRFDSTTATYLRQIGNLQAEYDVQQFSLYVQDAWRIRPNFTLNYGLRWEGQFNPAPEANNDLIVNQIRGFRFPSGHTFDPTVIPDDGAQLGPRLGFAWDPFSNGKTVVRAFSGIYYASTPMLLFASAINNFRNPPGDVSVQFPLSVASLPANSPLRTCNTLYCQFNLIGINLNNASLGNLPVPTTAQLQSLISQFGFNPFGGAAVTGMANDFKNPKSYQLGGGVEHELGRGLSVGVDYSQVNTIHLQRNRELNFPAPILRDIAVDPAQRPFYGITSGSSPLRARPLPQLGNIQIRESSARSVYQAMVIRANLRRTWGQISAFYTLSRSLSDDDNERDSGGITYENAFNLAPEFNYSRLDRRHQFVASPVFFLPFGVELSSAIRLMSGAPVDASLGGDANGNRDGVSTDRPYSAAGVPFKRNAFRNRAVYNVDFRAQKGFGFGENRRLLFTAEFFNILNLKNLTYGGAAAFNYCAPVTATCGFGAPTNATFLQLKDANGNLLLNNNPGQPFQVQLGARFQF